MNDLDKYIKRQKLIGILITVLSFVIFIASILVFVLVRPNGDYIWYMTIPIVISLGMIILGIGWYVMIKKTANKN